MDKARTANERADTRVAREPSTKIGAPISISIKYNFILITPG
jgi:hypothetical protein